MKIHSRIGTIPAACSLLMLCAAASAQTGPQDQDKVTHYTHRDGTQVTLVSGQPHDASYGPKPAFAQLDTNRDGFIDRNEAEAYVPLLNDFDHLAFHTTRVSQQSYANWDYR